MKLKRILSAVAAFALCASLAGCGASASSVAESTAESASTEAVSTVEEEASPETSAETTALRVAGLKGPTTMGLVNMLTSTCTVLPTRSCPCWSRVTSTPPLCPLT